MTFNFKAAILLIAFSGCVAGKMTAQQRDSCIVTQRRTIQGTSMEPLLKNGDKIELLLHYYQCGNPVTKGDIVAFHNASQSIPLIKMVRATDSDSLQLSGGYLLVNGDTLRNSANNVYRFREGEIKMLQLYIVHGHIPHGTYLVFGDNINTSTDSRKFGAVSLNDIIGKFKF